MARYLSQASLTQSLIEAHEPPGPFLTATPPGFTLEARYFEPPRMRRLAIAIVLLLGQSVAPAWAQWTEDAQKCAETSDPNLAFDLCTRAIQSGALSGSGLAVTFNNRGNAYQSKVTTAGHPGL
jgi:hypothetical protein